MSGRERADAAHIGMENTQRVAETGTDKAV